MAAARFAGANAVGSGGTRSEQRSSLANRAVTIHAINFHGGARFTVNFAVAVIVLGEVTIGALHTFFQMNVGQMHGFLEALRIIEGDGAAVFIQPVPFPVVVVDAAENPAVAVEIGELRGLELRVEFGAAGFFEKLGIAPQAAGGSGFGIAQIGLIFFFFRGIVLLGGIHFVRINFVVPPGQAEIGGDHVRARMNMANHALAGRNGAREGVLDGMTGFVLGNRGVGGRAVAKMAEGRVRAGVRRIAVVGVDNVAGGATAGAVIAGMIVRAWK